MEKQLTSWKLFLDDERHPTDSDWVVCRSVGQAIKAIKEKGFPTHISFDHDLGYMESTGYDFAQWIIFEEMDYPGFIPEDFSYYVHSQNPVGKRNIEGLLENFFNENKKS